MPRQTSIQLTPAMERQLEQLKAAGFGGTTDVVRLALDRMHQQEIDMYMTIFPTPREDGMFTLTDSKGNEQQEGYPYKTRESAIEAAKQLWPTNSVWEGKKVRNGWRIKVD